MYATIGLGAPWAGPGLSYAPVGQGLPRNDVELSREMLQIILEHLSTVIASEFSGNPIRLVAHGGACMLLHPGLYELANRKQMYHTSRGENPSRRTTTRDVDYIHRSFVAESESRGIINAGERLKKCIQITAQKFQLGADWMNSDADVALPMSIDPNTGIPFDPIYAQSVKENNIHLYTVFTSSNQQLTIVNVTPFWAVALKLVRYTKWDPGDICLLLLYGSVTRKVHWNAQNLENWIRYNCSAMNYHNWDSLRIADMRRKIDHAVALISSIGSNIMAQPDDPPLASQFDHKSFSKFGNTRTSANVKGLMHATKTIHSKSTSNVVMPSTGGVPWAGPASDALAARSSDPELELGNSSPRTSQEREGLIYDLGPKAPSRLIQSPSTEDRKRNARTGKSTDWIREHEEHMQRRSKYMLRSDEPDDSDDTDASSDIVETVEKSHGRAPVIPMDRRSKSVPSLSTDQPVVSHQWGSAAASFSDHSWRTQEPHSMSSFETSALPPCPPPIPDRRTRPPVTTFTHGLSPN
ncbi:hypothetical protein LENED_006405 [Lentinula edodes]|uniref:Uncharacterized protein n=1 Tax=Lentinula edodes TaxID=5353 RepID=A0A1Q3EBK7_LENED|nr:hypothetical protein LENED_006405 [Lentinula edodes]